jgi:hypothetical protein
LYEISFWPLLAMSPLAVGLCGVTVQPLSVVLAWAGAARAAGAISAAAVSRAASPPGYVPWWCSFGDGRTIRRLDAAICDVIDAMARRRTGLAGKPYNSP